jgi:predicted P-loop ATPase
MEESKDNALNGKKEEKMEVQVIAVESEDNLPQQTQPVGKLYEIRKYLTDNFDWRYNVIVNKVEFKKKDESEFQQMRDNDYNSRLCDLLDRNIQCDMNKLRTVLKSDFLTKFNPFSEYFFNLPEWNPDMPDYIELLGNTVTTANQELWLKCFKKWIVALTASAIDEIVVNHCMLVLTGGQGLGKTTWLTNLIPSSLQDYIMCGVPNLSDKDSKVQMSECILMNLDELGVLNTTKLNQLKEMITNNRIRLRKAYGYTIENYPRRASFCGSANERQFLTDTTGNRRFLAFDALNIDYQKKIDLDLVYSQAIHLYKNHFKFYFTKEDIAEINVHTDSFRLMSIEEEALMANFNPALFTDENVVFMTATEITRFLSRNERIPMGNASIQRMGKSLYKNGFLRRKVSDRYKWAVIRKE